MKDSKSPDKDHTSEYYEKLVQNAQKGTPYYIKLKNDPVIYRAIPMIDHGMDAGNDRQFLMKVLQPESHKGVFIYLVKDIEMLDTDPWHYNA